MVESTISRSGTNRQTRLEGCPERIYVVSLNSVNTMFVFDAALDGTDI